MADAESVDSIASCFLRAAQVESVINSSSNPAAVRTFLYRLPIHLRRQSHYLKIREYIHREQFPSLRRINWRRKWRARQHCICLRKTMASDMSGPRFLANHLESRQGLAVVWMVSHRRCHQNGCVKIRLHIPEESLIRSSRTASTTLSQSKPRGTLPR